MPKIPMLRELELKYKKNPNGLIFAALGEAYRKRGDYKKALKVLKKHLPYHPNYLLANITLAKCYYETGLFEEAQQVILSHVDENKENLQLQELYGDICIKLDLPKLAQKSLKRVLFYKPKCQETFNKLSLIEENISPSFSTGNSSIDIENWQEVSMASDTVETKKEDSSCDFMTYFDQKMEDFDDHFMEATSEADVFDHSNSDESALTELTLESKSLNKEIKPGQEGTINLEQRHQEFKEKIHTFLILLGSRKQIFQAAS